MTNKEQIKSFLSISSLILGILSLIMIFTPTLKLEALGMSEGLNGFEVVFGKSEEGIKFLGFSFGAFITYILAIAGGIFAFIGSKKNSVGYKVFAIICFLVATILFFCLVNVSVIDREIFQTELTDEEYKLAVDMMKGMMKSGVGAILGGVFCILGIITTAVELLFDKIFPTSKTTTIEQ